MTTFSGTQLGLVHSVRWEGRENNKIRTGLYLQRDLFSSDFQTFFTDLYVNLITNWYLPHDHHCSSWFPWCSSGST